MRDPRVLAGEVERDPVEDAVEPGQPGVERVEPGGAGAGCVRGDDRVCLDDVDGVDLSITRPA